MSTFKIFAINPNMYTENHSTDHFHENVYDLLKYDVSNGPYSNVNEAANILTSYLSKRPYIISKDCTLDNFSRVFELYVNPNSEQGRRYETKTCLDNENELIMYTYDYSMNRFPNTFNHLATIMGPHMETVFGPVFITKIKKTYMEGRKVQYEHVDIDYSDIVNVWFSTKQTTIWNFQDCKWSIDNMFNNNKSINASEYKYVNIGSNLVFYILNDGHDIDKNGLNDMLIKNDTDELNTYFKNIKICKLRTGEFVDEYIKYNIDLAAVKDHIAQSAIIGFEDQNKYQIVMESIFQNVIPDKLL
jgi:hypothetical protein